MDTTHFFGIPVAADSLGGMTLAMVLATLLGALIGLEREIHGHPAGLRTHILVSLGSALMTLVSVRLATMSGSDTTRIAAQIVTGVGFLGAGAIIREGGSIRGLTTAASIWTTAGVGMAVGAAPSLGSVAVIATAIVLFTLWVLHHVEQRLDEHGRRVRTIHIETGESLRPASRVIEVLMNHGADVDGVRTGPGRYPDTRLVAVRLRPLQGLDNGTLIAELAQIPHVKDVRMD